MEPVSAEVIDRIKRHIAASPDANEFCKRAVIHLIDQSRGLTRPVKMLVQSDMERRKDLMIGVHSMGSANGTTKLYQFLASLGLTNIYFQSWAYTPTDWGYRDFNWKALWTFRGSRIRSGHHRAGRTAELTKSGGRDHGNDSGGG